MKTFFEVMSKRSIFCRQINSGYEPPYETGLLHCNLQELVSLTTILYRTLTSTLNKTHTHTCNVCKSAKQRSKNNVLGYDAVLMQCLSSLRNASLLKKDALHQ